MFSVKREAGLSARSAEGPAARKAMAAQNWEPNERRRLIKLLSAGWLSPAVSSHSTSRPMGHRNAAISRAIAATTIETFLPVTLRRR